MSKKQRARLKSALGAASDQRYRRKRTGDMAADELREDIAAAKGKMRVKLGAGREIKRLTGYLWEGEAVEQMTTGAYGKGTGLVVLTDRRLLFVQDGMLSKTTEDFPIDKVSSVQWTSGLVLGQITIFASGNKSEIKNVNKDDGKEIVDKIRHRLSAPAPAPALASAPPPMHTPADPMEQLKKLGELRDAGVVTDAEFEAKKADLLSRM
jgi:Bacterial PH domain/Short C-terminal domain